MFSNQGSRKRTVFLFFTDKLTVWGKGGGLGVQESFFSLYSIGKVSVDFAKSLITNKSFFPWLFKVVFAPFGRNVSKSTKITNTCLSSTFGFIFGPTKKKITNICPSSTFGFIYAPMKKKTADVVDDYDSHFLPHCIVNTDSRFIFAPIVKTPAVTASAGKRKSAAAILFSLGFGVNFWSHNLEAANKEIRCLFGAFM